VINYLSETEQDELFALKNAINDSISSVNPNKMERFTELFVKTLSGKGPGEVFVEPSNF
jgi:hypothetical protein